MKKNSDDRSFCLGKRLKVNLLAMKLLAVLLFAGSMAVSGSSYSQKTKIDVQLQNSSLIFSVRLKSRASSFFSTMMPLSAETSKSLSMRKGKKLKKSLNNYSKGLMFRL